MTAGGISYARGPHRPQIAVRSAAALLTVPWDGCLTTQKRGRQRQQLLELIGQTCGEVIMSAEAAQVQLSRSDAVGSWRNPPGLSRRNSYAYWCHAQLFDEIREVFGTVLQKKYSEGTYFLESVKFVIYVTLSEENVYGSSALHENK